MSAKKKAGRKKGPTKLPELDIRTKAMLEGSSKLDLVQGLSVTKPSKRQLRESLAAYYSEADPRLSLLVMKIRASNMAADEAQEKDTKAAHREAAMRLEKKLGRVAALAAAIGDRAFFIQVENCLERLERYYEKSKGQPTDYPLRLLILKAQALHGFKAVTVTQARAYLEKITCSKFDEQAIRNDLIALGMLKKGGS